MNNVRLKILFFVSWYPNKYDHVLGNFIRNKAHAMSSVCDIAVMYAMKDNNAKNTFDIESTDDGSVFTVRVYFRTSSHFLLDALLYNIRFLQAYFKAWNIVKNRWGVPDLIHVNVADRAGLPALLFKWLRGIPYVITEHSTPDVAYTKGEHASPIFKKRWLKKSIWRNSKGGSVDSTISLKFLEKIGVTKKIDVIPNVVQVDRSGSPHTKFLMTVGKKIALHISIMIERKNVKDIIQAAARIHSKRKDFEIHIVGEGGQKEQLIDLSRALGILDTAVFFHGYVAEDTKVDLIKQSDFFILNSDEEGFSVVAAEALCYGVPVITTDCGGPEDFVNEKNGIIIRRRDVDGLTSAIEHMLDASQHYDRKQISRDACSRFTPEIIAHQTLELYKSAKTIWTAGNTKKQIFIPPDARVLDVGSGHQPNRRANVLLEKYPEETIHRTTQQIVRPSDKEFVVGDAQDMPFSDKSFDFIIASHIAEHVDDPVQFCRELSRVGKNGYIETPGPLTEYFMPTASHKWIVTRKNDQLHFRKNTVLRSKVPFFFRFFYLNRDGYVEKTLKTNNRVIKLMNIILLKLWAHAPYAYTRIVWKDTIAGVVRTK
jgi:L-malate glycosyltransferase